MEDTADDGDKEDHRVSTATDVFQYDVHDRGVTLEHLAKEQKDGYDPNKDWKDSNFPKRAKATVGVAVTEAWEQGKIELEHIRSKLQDRTEKERPRIDDIFDLVYGEESDAFKTFQKDPHKIFVSHDEFLQFLATFFLSSAYQVSTKQLFDPYSRINMAGTIGEEDYKRIWWKIGEACLPDLESRNRNITPTGMVPLWMQLERSYNQFTRELVLLGFPGKLQVTLDDDKPHAQMHGFSAGIKIMRHTKDNVNGHTLHTHGLIDRSFAILFPQVQSCLNSQHVERERIDVHGVEL